MRVVLGPPEPSVALLVERYARRGRNDDLDPFRSANFGLWSCHTRGPITRQTAVPALFSALAQLPEPWASHLRLPGSRDHLDGDLSPLTRDAFVAGLIGHLAHHQGGVCSTATPEEATETAADLLKWLGHRPRLYLSSQLFRVGACWSYAYIGVATGHLAIVLFLQID